jgi:dienelactone hydrolase
MRLIAALVVAALSGTAAAAAPEPVDIASGELTLHAVIYRPEGSGPFPAVVALHACDGLTVAGGAVAPRYADWGEQLVGAGFVVLFPDSYGTRGLGPQCGVRGTVVRARRERVSDANAARRWLQSQDYVMREHVSLIGWANGGVAALWTIRRHAVIKHDGTDFRSVVAFYPVCRRLAESAWSARQPTLLLLASADDWAAPGLCEQMAAGARGRSARVTVIIYSGAHHDFDDPNLPLTVRSGLAVTADGSGRAHVGTDPVARADALKRVPQWLKR